MNNDICVGDIAKTARLGETTYHTVVAVDYEGQEVVLQERTVAYNTQGRFTMEDRTGNVTTYKFKNNRWLRNGRRSLHKLVGFSCERKW